MTFLEILLLALALAVDAFTVGAAVGVRHRRARQLFRLSWHFGLFQALLPLLGAASGRLLRQLVASFSRYLAFALLSFVAARMLRDALSKEEPVTERDLTRGLSLVTLSLAVSIDALAVGFTLGLRGGSILVPVLVIGVVAGLLTLVGMLLAGRIADRFGRGAEIAAALVLFGIGVKTLVGG